MFSRLIALGVLLTSFGGAEAAVPQTAVPAWKPMPLITQESLHAGVFPGGEGAQMTRCLVISQADPNFMLKGTDVGGNYRSLDGGKTWQVCLTGWNTRGANSFAIDPRNPSRVLGWAAGADWNPQWGTSPNGLYLSTDKAASWRQILPNTEAGDWRVYSLAYDPSSYDPKLGYCTVAYWDSMSSGLYKTTDGGLTWACVSKEHGGGMVKVHPTKGFVYVTDTSKDAPGFYKSTDGGVTFRRTLDQKVGSIDVIASRPETVYAGADFALVSTDAGETFHPVGANQGLKGGTEIRMLAVDPADPQNMACNYSGKEWWESYSYYTSDGGATWQKPGNDRTNTFLPANGPLYRFAYHPTKPGLLFSDDGNGCVTRSTDAGKVFHWSNNGQNAVMLGGLFNFSATSPQTVFLSFQDFNGASTADSGKSWVYHNPAGNDWGGFEYGGYTPDGTVFWTGDSPGWYDKRTLKVSYDSGKTWAKAKDASGSDIVFAGPDVSYSDPRNPDVCFASNWRSADRGHTWTAMTGCEGVFTASPLPGHLLYGKHGNKICTSSDHGVTWTDVTPDVAGGFKDIACDPKHSRIYAASEGRLKQCEGGQWSTLETPKDQRGGIRVESVAVDPGNPDLVYASGPANIYKSDATVIASTDGGASWANLTVTTPLASPTQTGGPHEVSCVRVNPVTHDLWAAGQCFGFWRIAAADVRSYAMGAPKVASVPKAETPVPFTVHNASMTEGQAVPDNWGSWSDVTLARDTVTYKSAPSSLRVTPTKPGAQGSGYQMLDAPGGTKFTVSGEIKTKGIAGIAAVQSFDGNWKPIDFHQVKYVAADQDWTSFRSEVTLPAGTAHFSILLLANGSGDAWLDDVAVTQITLP